MQFEIQYLYFLEVEILSILLYNYSLKTPVIILQLSF